MPAQASKQEREFSKEKEDENEEVNSPIIDLCLLK